MKSLMYLYRIGSGPSSSHTMGPERCAKYMLDKYPSADSFKVVLYGSLALTGKGHLTDYIINKTFFGKAVDISYDIISKIPHPNTIKIAAYERDKLLDEKTFISIGGGSIIICGEESETEEDIYPFNSFSEIKNYCINNKISLADFVYRFEGEEIKQYLKKVYQVMKDARNRGVSSTGTLPGKLKVERKANILFQNRHLEENMNYISIISSYAYAISEENASGGTIVTAPTCGSCGVLPAVLLYLEEKDCLPEDKIIDALAVSSVFGNVIKTNASISGALAGCQSEIGSACSMASAAISYLKNYNIEAIECSAEIAMEHHLGLTCDPIEGLVQIPCIERNAVAALRAMESSMLSGVLYSSRKISFDMVVKSMYETGKDLNSAYKETSLGGLAKYYQDK